MRILCVIFTVAAILYGLYFDMVMISWTFAILALAWSHEETKKP